MDFKKRITESFAVLFGEASEENEYSLEAQFGKRWGWYQSIYALAKGDIRRFSEVERLPIHECLTYLSFEKERIELERKEIESKFK